MATTGSGTLTANTVETVTLSGHSLSFSFEEVLGIEVMNRTGDEEIWFTIGPDPDDPTIEGEGCLCVPAAICSYVASVRWSAIRDGQGEIATGIVVKMVSAGTPKYSVTGV